MPELQAFPSEIFASIINHLIVSIGIDKASRLRIISKTFNSAILYAICVAQVVDINDPATPWLARNMSPKIKGQIFLTKSRSDEAKHDSTLRTIAKLNDILDGLTHATGEQQIQQHRVIAETIAHFYPTHVRETNKPEMGDNDVLCGAIAIGDLELVKYLYGSPPASRYGANKFNERSIYLGWPLQIAAAWGHIDIVCFLLDNAADPHKYEKNEPWEPNMDIPIGFMNIDRDLCESALLAAVLRTHEEIIQLLIQPQYLISTSKVEYFRVIVAACEVDNLNLVQTLIDATGKSLCDFPGLREEMFWHAAYHGRYRMMQMLLNNGVDVNAAPYPDYRTHGCALSIAAKIGNIRTVRFLLDHGADPNFQHFNQDLHNPIDNAAYHGQEEVVELLLAHGADPATAFYRAADGGQARLMKWLANRYPQMHLQSNPDGGITVGMSALLRAIAIKNPAIITLLVKMGTPLNEGYAGSAEIPIDVAKWVAEWIVELLFSLGAEDRETDLGYRGDNYSEEQYDRQMTRGGVRITKRTWEWVGKY